MIFFSQDLKHEQERIRRTNIVVCTPGRLLQHMDETPDFTCNSLQVLGNEISTSPFLTSIFTFNYQSAITRSYLCQIGLRRAG